MKKGIFIVIAAILLNSCTNAQNEREETSLSAIEFAERIRQTGQAQLIDVRTPAEFEKGHLENALNIDWNGGDFQNQVLALDKSKPVFVYCLSGGRSASAANALRQNGFEKVYEMPGGIMEWRSKGLPEKTDGTAAKGMTLPQYTALLNTNKLVLVDFYAEWCAPCKKMEPYLKEISVGLADKVIVIRIDADTNPELCKELNVSALPVLKLYKDKQKVWEHVGFISEKDIREKIGIHEKR